MTADRDHWVYLNYDEFGEVLYVGCTKNIKRRHREHRQDYAGWLPYMARTALKGPYTYKVARRIERELINQLDPWFNQTSAELSFAQKCMAEGRRAVDRLLRENPEATAADVYDLDLPHAPDRGDMLASYLNCRSQYVSAAA